MKKAVKNTQLHTINTKVQLPSLTGGPDTKLHLSVTLSSCADLTISKLFTELWMLRTHAIDFYPRLLDVKKMIERRVDEEGKKEKVEDVSLLERFRYEGDGEDGPKGNIRELGQYIQEERKKAAENIKKIFGIPNVSLDLFQIPAITTFFPDISSRDKDVAEQAGYALAGAVELAKMVGAKVVEFVMGRRVERCGEKPLNQDDFKCDFVYNSQSDERLRNAVKIIKKYVYPKIKHDDPDKCVRLAAEIEPGFSYVLNSRQAVAIYIQLIKNMDKHVGLNLDIGHLIILANAPREEDRISTADVELWKKHIFHAHISDNIGYHFRDLVPGTIHPLYGGVDDLEFERWIKICKDIAVENPSYSGYIALELEGCGRIQWIQQSLLRLGYLIRRVNSKKG